MSDPHVSYQQVSKKTKNIQSASVSETLKFSPIYQRCKCDGSCWMSIPYRFSKALRPKEVYISRYTNISMHKNKILFISQDTHTQIVNLWEYNISQKRSYVRYLVRYPIRKNSNPPPTQQSKASHSHCHSHCYSHSHSRCCS